MAAQSVTVICYVPQHNLCNEKLIFQIRTIKNLKKHVFNVHHVSLGAKSEKKPRKWISLHPPAIFV